MLGSPLPEGSKSQQKSLQRKTARGDGLHRNCSQLAERKNLRRRARNQPLGKKETAFAWEKRKEGLLLEAPCEQALRELPATRGIARDARALAANSERQCLPHRLRTKPHSNAGSTGQYRGKLGQLAKTEETELILRGKFPALMLSVSIISIEQDPHPQHSHHSSPH